jgi:hypothetical protein
MYFHECTLNRSILIHVSNINRTFLVCEKFEHYVKFLNKNTKILKNLDQFAEKSYSRRDHLFIVISWSFGLISNIFFNSVLYIAMFYIKIPLFLYLVYEFDFVHSHLNSNWLDSYQRYKVLI